MPGIVIVGAQWGDEGKGKITDLLAEHGEAVVRFQGGNNAGHTIVRGDQEWKLHLIPSGILYPGKRCVNRQRVVIDPRVLIEELDGLRAKRVDVSGLRISANAHLIMPTTCCSTRPARPSSEACRSAPRGGASALLCRQGPRGSASACRTCSTRRSSRKKIVAAMEPKRLSLRPFEKTPRSICAR